MGGMVDADRNVSVSRRELLRATAGTGVGLATVSQAVAAEGDGVVEIPIVKSGDEVFYSKTVPEKWWNYTKRVGRVQRQLQQRYETVETVAGVGQTVTDREITPGRNGNAAVVYVDPVRGTDADIPDQVNDVSVETREILQPDPDCYEQDYNNVPGGVKVEHGGYNASATCPVRNSSGALGLMTCGHLFDDCSQDPYGLKLEQSSQLVGYVDDHSVKQDWVFVPKDSNADVDGFKDSIVSASGEIAGYVTRSGIQDMMDTGELAHHTGIASCESDGLVESLDVSVGRCDCGDGDCVYSSNNYVKVTTMTKSGDSGGPHFRKFEKNGTKYLGIIAPHHGGESVGCAAYRIHNDHGYTFGTN